MHDAAPFPPPYSRTPIRPVALISVKSLKIFNINNAFDGQSFLPHGVKTILRRSFTFHPSNTTGAHPLFASAGTGVAWKNLKHLRTHQHAWPHLGRTLQNNASDQWCLAPPRALVTPIYPGVSSHIHARGADCESGLRMCAWPMEMEVASRRARAFSLLF